MAEQRKKIGLWIVGASGAVGSTVALGLAAWKRGLIGTTGLVSELPVFERAGLARPDDIVLGGHEVRAESIGEAIAGMHARAGLFDASIIKACGPSIRAMQRNIRPGTLWAAGPAIKKLADPSFCPRDRSAAAAVERLTADLVEFRRDKRLDQVVVIHAASSEPAIRAAKAHGDYPSLQKALGRSGSRAFPASSLYALSTIEAGCAYVNFTPSTGVDLPAIRQRADAQGIAYMGRDGKTGESLVKSVLAPMFAMRNLSVLSWSGQNLLGNRDGEVLRDAKTRASKIRTKDGILPRILGYRPATHVSIDYVASLDDWKVAWDFIHFEGFLGAKMNMQFTWHGSDSILAAPLILDLARFAALEARRGRSGVMRHLGYFFKDPMEATEHDLFRQWNGLVEHVTKISPLG